MTRFALPVEWTDQDLLALTDAQASILNDKLQRRRARLLALRRYPEPGKLTLAEVIFSPSEVFLIQLEETEKRGAWYVYAERFSGGKKVVGQVGPYYRFHTIAPNRLLIQNTVGQTGCGATVLSIYIESRNAPPAACEVVLRVGELPRVSAWRRGANRQEALLPHSGRRVRMGDAVFAVREKEEMRLFPDELPRFLRRVEGLPAYLGTWRNNEIDQGAVFQPETFPVRLRHPDHYEVVLEGEPGDLVYASEVAGETDFRRPGMPGD